MAKEEYVVQFTDANFEQEVLKSEKPVLVDFWAPWCAPCRKVGPVVEELAESYNGRVKVGKVNVDDNSKTAEAYNVMTIPTLVLFNKGGVMDKLVGALPKERLEKLIKKAL
jgi:thioredoxin